MNEETLRRRAEEAGIAPSWHDVFGTSHEVSPDTLRAVLAAIGEATAPALPPLLTGVVGEPIPLTQPPGDFELLLEDGTRLAGRSEAHATGAVLPPVPAIGYHTLRLAAGETRLAVAPPRCFGLAEAGALGSWGLAVQLYALRRAGDGGIGDFRALAEFVRAAGAQGAAAVAISPVHAQFAADVGHFSPYAPSSRVAMNALHADPGAPTTPEEVAEAARLEALTLIDWPAASTLRLDMLRRCFGADAKNQKKFNAFRRSAGAALELHARFEALHARHFGADQRHWHWRDWPAAYRDPQSPEIAAFARDNASEIAFHAWLQWRAESGMAEAQAAARAAGMPIGLIADLAVGTDSGGSHAWSRQDQMLIGASIGAPPDLLSREGQNWGLVAFSPGGLVRHGFGAFLEMLRAALRHAGGVRIDHVMGLSRLWVVPDGAPASAGAYLRFPLTDLLRLVALESWRHRAIVLGEDLGTVPEGFRERLQEAGLLGMRVLMFERAGERFLPPREWPRAAAAMSSTHDLPTIAGWWAGRDIDWRAELGLPAPDVAWARGERAAERDRLWQALCESGAASGAPPEPAAGDAIADAALAHLGRAGCELALIPVEDALGLPEQPNLPGTTDQHPNWRRRLPGPAATLLDAPPVRGRLAALAQARRAG